MYMHTPAVDALARLVITLLKNLDTNCILSFRNMRPRHELQVPM